MSAFNPRVRVYKTYPAHPPEIPEPVRYLVVRDSVNITFYMRRPHSELRHAVADALEVYCQAVGRQKLTSYRGYSDYWQDLDDQGWAEVQAELRNPEGGCAILREWATTPPGHEFTYLGRSFDGPGHLMFPDEAATLSFWLPTEYLEERGPGWVRELALELGAQLPFSSGHAGLFFQSAHDTTSFTEDIRAACFDYPGMDIMRVSELANHIGTRVKGAHWLTFLGQPVLGELGGVAGLRSRLHAPGTMVQELEGDRAVVTLGKRPEAGDGDSARTLAPYRELARVLEPWLYRERTPWRGFTEDDMRRWERRLLDQAP
jgi:hypothetical protein